MKVIKTIGITGANGALGKALTKKFRNKGFKVIGFTTSKDKKDKNDKSPNTWVYWECGKEFLLKKYLQKIDILILNHGIYKKDNQNLEYADSIQVNALSKFKIINLFEEVILNNNSESTPKEIWINTSEAEILPSLNPAYEISKLLIARVHRE